MTRTQEARQKVEKLREYMGANGISGVLIEQQPNFSYITAGGRGFLGLASVQACAKILVTHKSMYLLANVIEGPRLMAEEMPEGMCELKAVPWQADGGLRRIASQLVPDGLSDDSALGAYFQRERMCLCEDEASRFGALGRDSADALERALLMTRPGDTERRIAGRISAELWDAGAEPISLFIAADERSDRVRHYVPTDKAAHEKVIASICARRGGLIISATRSIALSAEFGNWQRAYDKLLCVEAAMLASLIPGAAMSAALDAGCAAYDAAGMTREYDNHHQGGATGYLPREIRVDAGTQTVVERGMAFAFNPSCAGAKVEDTVLVTDAGVRLLSDSGNWPCVSVNGVRRPRIVAI